MKTGGDGPGIGSSIVPLIIIMAVVGWIKGKRRKEPKELEEPWQYEEWEGRW